MIGILSFASALLTASTFLAPIFAREPLPMAENICASFEDQVLQGQAESNAHINGAGPALDANTSGTGNPQNEKHEPKNMAEAMKMIADQRKKERQQ